MTDVLATARCPQCAALVRPGQPWCTLCHADLRPAPTPPAPPGGLLASQPPGQSYAEDPLSGELPDDLSQPVELTAASTASSGGRHARQGAGSLDAGPAQALSSVGDPVGGVDRPGPSDREIDAMLAELATQSADPLAGVVKRFDTRGAKIGLAVGLCVASIVAMMIGAFMLAAIFG